jgi:hypothetical protein
MGGSASKIWSEICALESDTVRAHMIETVLRSPDLVAQSKMVGIYGTVMAWLTAQYNGSAVSFPYATGSTQQSTQQSTRNMMYTTPTHTPSYRQGPPPAHPSLMSSSAFSSSSSTAIMVSPSAKAHDYFQEAVEMLGIGPDEQITQDRLRSAYKRASLKAHPDKGGSKEAFDEVSRAYRYVEKILVRINPRFSVEGSSITMSGPSMTISDVETPKTITVNTRTNSVSTSSAPPPVKLSAKKLDMGMFNKMFEENRMPDPDRDSGYGGWMKSSDDAGAVGADPRLKGKFSSDVFESVFRERVSNKTGERGREELYAQGGVEIGGASNNFTAAFGSDNQFTDIKEAYTNGATMFQHVADVKVSDRRMKSAKDFERARAEELTRKDPAEAARFQAEVEAETERERQRQARVAEQEKMTNSWAEGLRRRLTVSDS